MHFNPKGHYFLVGLFSSNSVRSILLMSIELLNYYNFIFY